MMAIQLIFVVESDEKSQSDYIYIQSVLNKQYNVRLKNNIKISRVFMRGKGNYNKKRVLNEIANLERKYSKIGKSQVIYCFDTDLFESKNEDKMFLEQEKTFCEKNNYDFVWFCHTIEEVFWGESSPKAEKTQKAVRFSANPQLNNLELHSDVMRKGKSNLRMILDNYLK